MSETKTDQRKSFFPILIAEDNHIARKFLEKILIDAGYAVSSAPNGRKALELFREKFFPVVLSDWMMPEMNGLELCAALREESRDKGYVFIVLLTAKDAKEDIISGLQAGADDYLTKPINHPELIARLNTGMRILELERNLRDANEKIKHLSITDPLTGCFNRGYMNQKLAQEIRRCQRYNHPLTIVFCDIDHFKAINDTYGHQAGDYVLKEFTHCIAEQIRIDLDWLSRYGGEEFLVVLPETTLDGGYEVAERIRVAVSQKSLQWEDKLIKITSSFGVTGFDIDALDFNITPEFMLCQADKNLYQSKNTGRNRTTSSLLIAPFFNL